MVSKKPKCCTDKGGQNSEIRNIIYLPKLSPNESKFLQLVSENNVDSVENLLRDNSGLNIKCQDFQGTTALHIAVRKRSEAMVKFLLQQPSIDIGDTVLQVVRDNNIKILVMLLDAQKKVSPGLEFAGATHSSEFPEHVTPLILAAQLGHHDIVALLIARGHTILRPHHHDCGCLKCMKSLTNGDLLHTRRARLSVYRAITSPAYLIHVSSDLILDAFLLTAELTANAEQQIPLTAAYLQLSREVSSFAANLIGCCRTSLEVELILKQKDTMGYEQFVLPRLLMAVNYKQKEFVAHPNTQEVLISHWIGGWYSWNNKYLFTKVNIILCRIFFTPFILLACMVAPRSQIVRHYEIPLNKLITHAAAYCVFLALVFYISNQDKTKQKRGPPNTGVEAPLVLYVCGYTWSSIRMCLLQGPRVFFAEMWNWVEIITLSLFGLTFALWIVSAMDIATYDNENKARKYWNQYDPTLLAEGTLCLATIFAYIRLLLFCQLNHHLGPLQVSLGKMTIDIRKYVIVFTIVTSAFAAGLARFYQYYDGMVYEDTFGMKTVQVSSFTSLADTLKTLFWALFCMSPVESAHVILGNVGEPRTVGKIREYRHGYTESIGYVCFGCFEVISVIVILNMLIATISNTFQRVNDNVAIEWTFGRTQVYVNYMSQTTLPSPYNLIPTASGMNSVFKWFRAKISDTPGVRARWSLSHCCYIEKDLEAGNPKEYSALMSVLAQRYFRLQSPASSRTIEDELESIHQEIGALSTKLNMKQ